MVASIRCASPAGACWLVAVAVVLLFVPSSVSALQFGTYRCWSYNVSGGGGSCRLAAPIVINADGTYQESSTRGTYRVAGDRIQFSESTIRGPGTLAGENQIVFEYDYGGRRHNVTYLCQDCAAGRASATSVPGASAPSARVWAQVRLQFARPDGFLNWANSAHLVPFEQARQFASGGSATPPPGSSTGSAYMDDRQTVIANFRQATGGRDYVIFLDSGRERIPVGNLHLPVSPAEQTLTINASLTPSSIERPAAAPIAPAAPSPTPRSESGGLSQALEALGALAQALQQLGSGQEQASLSPPPSASAAPDYPPIGVQVMDVTPEIAQALGNPSLKGAGVRRVQSGLPAERAGVQEGDIILAVNGSPVESVQELIRALGHRRSGAASTLTVFRAGQIIEVVVP